MTHRAAMDSRKSLGLILDSCLLVGFEQYYAILFSEPVFDQLIFIFSSSDCPNCVFAIHWTKYTIFEMLIPRSDRTPIIILRQNHILPLCIRLIRIGKPFIERKLLMNEECDDGGNYHLMFYGDLTSQCTHMKQSHFFS